MSNLDFTMNMTGTLSS